MLIPLSELELETILEWRNQPEVRKYSFNDDFISKAEHYRWWQKIKDDPTKKWMIFQQDKKLLGVVNYYDIKAECESYWGFYLASELPDHEKLRLWFSLEKEAIKYAFDELKLKKLKCEIFRFNKAALFMHKRSGYQEIDTYQHERGEVVVLELQASWVKNIAR